jgi:glycosyltransferase involved in cell wall biosynthesis
LPSLRILAITPRVLEPADTGGRIRSRKLFEQLSRLHEVTLFCLRTPLDSDDQVAAMRSCCSSLHTVDWHEDQRFSLRFYRALAREFWNPIPHTVLKYRSMALRRAVLSALLAGRHDVLFCDFLHMAINCREIASVPKVLFQHNVEFEIRRGLAEHATNPLAKAYLSRDATKLRRYEQQAAVDFDHCITVSDADAGTMRRLYGVTHVSAIPSAVDSGYFQPAGDGTPHSCVFLGSMDMLANQDAVRFFVRDILPRIRRDVPVFFAIVGRNPPPSIRRFAGDLAGVTVTGTVDDVRPHLAAAQVLVVPLRIGGGTRIKIFEAMAMGVPVVSTRLGAAGLPVTDGENILLADTPGDFAAAVVRVIRDHELRRRLAANGRRLVTSGYSWARAADHVSSVCEQVVAARRLERGGDNVARIGPPAE